MREVEGICDTPYTKEPLRQEAIEEGFSQVLASGVCVGGAEFSYL